MSIPAIDNLSSVLYVPRVTQQQTRASSVALSQSPAAVTSIAPSRSQTLARLAAENGKISASIVEAIGSLVSIAEKTSLPSSHPNLTRVNLEADLNKLLQQLDNIANSAEVGSVSLLRSDRRTIYLETNELGGSIKAQGTALDSQALGLSNISVLSDLGVKDASSRVDRAIYAVQERLDRIGQLNEALTRGFNYGSLTNATQDGSSFGNNVAQDIAVGNEGFYQPIQYSNPLSGQYSASSFNRGSFVNLIG